MTPESSIKINISYTGTKQDVVYSIVVLHRKKSLVNGYHIILEMHNKVLSR